MDTRAFEIYFALQEFGALKQHLSITPMPPGKLFLKHSHKFFFLSIQMKKTFFMKLYIQDYIF